MSDHEDDREELGEILWSGRQWAVTDFGLETLDRDIAYSVPADQLGRKTYGKTGAPEDDTDEPETLAHLSSKSWVDVEDLIVAFAKALEVHAGKSQRITPTGLEKGVALARSKAALREIIRATRQLDGLIGDNFGDYVDEWMRDNVLEASDA